MKTRPIVSALVIATLSLGSVSSFAQGYARGDGHERFEQRANAGWQGAYQRGQDRRVAQAEAWHARREWREHEHERHGSYAQPGYYAQPVYSYQQPVYSYQPPVYYGGQYAEPNAAADVVLGAIVGGVIGQAIANH